MAKKAKKAKSKVTKPKKAAAPAVRKADRKTSRGR
jgi:hypothetical protein